MKKRFVLLQIMIMAFALSYRSEAQTSSIKEELTRAMELAKQGQTEEASKICTDIMTANPANRDAVQYWLMINMKRSPTGEQEAIGQLDELEKSHPGNAGIIFFKAFLQTEYGHLDEALANTEKLIAMQPDTALNWLMKGQILEGMNKPDEALTALEKATVLAPDNADAWQIKAGLLAKANKFDEAIASYDKAVDLAPGQPVFIYNRGCVYCRKGDNVKALADLGKAVSMNPEFKSYAQKDEDFKSLWDNEEFKKLTAQ